MGAMGWSTGRSKLISLVVVVIVAAAAYVAAFGLPGAGAASPSYTGCVSLYTGQFRVLLYGGSCTASEIPITFGETGPPGPPGPPGPAGTLESLLNVAYNGNEFSFGTSDQPVVFDTTVESFGPNIIQGSSTNFTLGEAGLYRVDFILQGNLQGAGGARVLVNGSQVGPLFRLPTAVVAVGNEQQLSGSVVIDAFAGDVVQIGVTGASILPLPLGTSQNAGCSLIITQLTSTPAP